MSISQVRQIHTRNSARKFGLNITNIPIDHLAQIKKSKCKKEKPALTSQWQTLQPEVHPYMSEINDHTHKYQHQSYILDNFMPRHKQINISMREILMGWLVEVQPQLCFNHHTLYLAVLIVDKYCHARPINRNKYQLLGITALFIAAKYEEVRTPKLKQYYAICGGEYSIETILWMESDILIALAFRIKSMTTCWHLQQYIQLAKIQSHNKQLCFYILDLSLLEFDCCLMRPTQLAWAIVFYVLRVRNLPMISQHEVCKYFYIATEELSKSVDCVVNLFNKRRQPRFKSVNQKYQFRIGHITT